ncbi:MAG: methionyl-tRNA formyltransferase [Clostridiales bacterium]|nr:methionyl-tRNA formyltransferase [Clostridiales bacterium]
MRIVFMGTPDFSVPTLKSLLDSRHQVIAVVTQPDKPKGRGRAVAMSPVKECALEHGIPVYQPVRARDETFIREMEALAPDVMVVIAFGQILSQDLLDVPRYGCVNIHASLLPKYRGASPIQWAVLNGDEETGVTTMQMAAGMDTGDILETVTVRLDPKETGGSLFDRLSQLEGNLILSTLERMEQGTIVPQPQNDAEATYVKKIPKTMGEIDWSSDASSIERLVRGLNPWPSAYTHVGGKMLKIWEADVLPEDASANIVEPGTVLEASGSSLLVAAGRGVLKITSLQLEGKKRMDTAAFLRGYSLKTGDRMGTHPERSE